MLVEKKMLSLEEIEAQSALELPDREMLALVVITIGDVTVDIDVRNVDIAAQICAAVLTANTDVTCEIVQ